MKVPVYHFVDKNIGDGMNPLVFNSLCKGFSFKHLPTMPPHSDTPCILGIGSILSWNKDVDASNQIVCGSGFIHSNKIPERPLKIISVRGPMTRGKFIKAGIECPQIYGDLALLTRYVIKAPDLKKKYSVGVIPHYVDKEHPFVIQAKSIPNWTVIDINQAYTPSNFIKELHECEYILSSTLHGIILSDSYGIPAYHVQLSDKVIGGDWKFRDYFLSVKRKYKPIDISELGAIEKQIIPYKVKFDFDGYHDYIKHELKMVVSV